MKKETRDEAYELLKRATVTILKDIEEESVITIGRDEIEKRQLIGTIAGITYGELTMQIRKVVNDYLGRISNRVNKI